VRAGRKAVMAQSSASAEPKDQDSRVFVEAGLAFVGTVKPELRPFPR